MSALAVYGLRGLSPCLVEQCFCVCCLFDGCNMKAVAVVAYFKFNEEVFSCKDDLDRSIIQITNMNKRANVKILQSRSS